MNDKFEVKKAMEIIERVDMLKAMEKIARTINDEGYLELWLINGIADGDINGTETIEELEYYTDNEVFADIMDTFLWVMHKAYISGGLYCSGIVSKPRG